MFMYLASSLCSSFLATLRLSFCSLFSNSVASNSYPNYPDTELAEVEGSHTFTITILLYNFIRGFMIFINTLALFLLLHSRYLSI
jgi:hypothetical protein